MRKEQPTSTSNATAPRVETVTQCIDPLIPKTYLVAIAGRLTGGFTSEPELDRVGYEVAIDELHKSPPAANIVDPITIYVDIGAVDPADFAAAIVAEIPVVVMAEWLDRAGGERPFADIEGFVTGCPGGPLLGFTGTQGEWTEVIDLDDPSTRLGPE